MSYKHLDDFITKFSDDITTIKKLEKLKDEKNIHKVFNKLLNLLLKRKRYGLDQMLWSELYFHSIYFYDKVYRIGNIPVKIVTKHNNILPFYMSQNLHTIETTIVHFDTHPDMNNIKKSPELPKLYEKYIQTKSEKYIKESQEIVWDIGAAISGVLFTTGIQNYIWCMPEWIPDPEVKSTYYLKKNKNSINLYTNDKNLIDDYLCDIEYNSKYNDEDTAIYAKIHTSKNIKCVEKIISIIGDSNNYILDIDLDYFVSNGTELNKKNYMKEPYDVQSTYRTNKQTINENNPRNASYKSDELYLYEKQLKNEIKYINKRIKFFLSLITLLKKKGYTPSHISICDSTNIQFADCRNCNTISNGYVPTNLSLYVNTHIFDGLFKLFN